MKTESGIVLPNGVKKPPLGLRPNEIWREETMRERLVEVDGAIHRYREALLEVPKLWTDELIQLVQALQEIKDGQEHTEEIPFKVDSEGVQGCEVKGGTVANEEKAHRGMFMGAPARARSFIAEENSSFKGVPGEEMGHMPATGYQAEGETLTEFYNDPEELDESH